MMFQLPKVIAGCLVIPAVFGESEFLKKENDKALTKAFRKSNFIKNFKGFTKSKVMRIIKNNEWDLGRKDKPLWEYTWDGRKTKTNAKKSWYQLDLEKWEHDIPEFNLDPEACLKYAKKHYSDEFYENEKNHYKNAYGWTRNSFLWWANHIVRQFLPDNIRFQTWQDKKSDFDTIHGDSTWTIITEFTVWRKFLQQIAYICKWNQKDEINDFFGIKELKNVLRGKGRDGKKTNKLYDKFNKYYCWMRHTLFYLGCELRPWTNRWSFTPKIPDYNQVLFCARLVEILHFFKSDECIEHMESISKQLESWLLTSTVTHGDGTRMDDYTWRKLKRIYRRYTRLVMMLKPKNGEVPEKFKLTKDEYTTRMSIIEHDE